MVFTAGCVQREIKRKEIDYALGTFMLNVKKKRN